jgi:hypothetical protein
MSYRGGAVTTEIEHAGGDFGAVVDRDRLHDSCSFQAGFSGKFELSGR